MVESLKKTSLLEEDEISPNTLIVEVRKDNYFLLSAIFNLSP